MKHAWKSLAAALGGLFALAAAQAAEVGEPAPDFALEDTRGKRRALSDYEGKVVVLEWINHGCPYVQKHYNSGAMQKLQRSMGERGVVWLSVCSSAPGTQGHMGAAKWNQVNEEKGSGAKAVLIDEDGEIGRRYGAVTTPHMYVIDRDGTLVYNGAIDSIRSTDVADIDRAENYVAAAVEATLAGEPAQPAKTKPYGCSVKYAAN